MSKHSDSSILLPGGVPVLLDGQPVPKITAFLFPKGGNENPKTLLANADKSFQGSIVLGMGFTFDDSSEEATPIAEMERLIAENPKNQERIFPYIGGSEVNSSPTHAHHRYVIDFFDRSEEDAWQWPELMEIVKEKVKPFRDIQKRKAIKERWWQYAEKRPGMVRAITTCDHVLVIPEVTAQFGFAFLPANCVFAHTLKVVASESFSIYTCVQSRLHEIWARFFGSSLEDRLRYTSSDCFETFPFPPNWQTSPTLESIGSTYYHTRAALMLTANEGLTDTYNRFHDPAETAPNIHHLRDLHSQMDRAVLDAYDWQDISTTCGFALDYLDTDTTDLPPEAQERINSGDLFFATAAEATSFDNLIRSSASTRKKKLPWRYRWPESTHDEVLARLLDLNQQRYEEEVKSGLHSKKQGKRTKENSKRKNKGNSESDQLSLIQE